MSAITLSEGRNIRQKRSPMQGLLLYFLLTIGTTILMIQTQALVWGIIYVISGNIWIHMFFGINAIAAASFAIIMNMTNKDVIWERFKLTMPIRRSDLAASQYLSVAIASVVGMPLYVVISWLGAVFNEGVYFTFSSVLVNMSSFLSTPLLLSGFIFPLACVKALEDKQEWFFMLIMLASMAIPQAVIHGAARLGWSFNVASGMVLAVALTVFLVSYFIYRKLCVRIDF